MQRSRYLVFPVLLVPLPGRSPLPDLQQENKFKHLNQVNYAKLAYHVPLYFSCLNCSQIY